MSLVNLTTLIVNYLPQNLTDAEFTKMFSDIAPVVSCKIVRDRTTGYSFGFGFVEYAEENQAAAAIDKLNGTKIQNKTIKVAYSRKGENVKGANLFVSNIPKTFAVDDLKNIFKEFGNIVQCRILSDQVTGESKGTGFVLFDTRDEAEAARNALNGKIPAGFANPIVINFAEDKGRTNQTAFVAPQAKVNTEMGATNSSMDMMTPYGMLGSSMMNPFASGMTPFGADYGMAAAAAYFMQCAGFYNESMFGMQRRGMFGVGGNAMLAGGGGMASSAVGGGDGGGIMRGKMIRAARGGARFNPLSAAPPAGKGLAPGAPPGYIIFAYNIGTATSEANLRTLFSLYGAVTKVDVIWDFEKNQGKGYGFVTMPNYDEAAFAISQLNGYNYAGKPLQVSFKTKKE